MKKLLIVCLFCSLGAMVFGQDKSVSGDWEGRFAGKLRLIFHFTSNSGGKLTGKFDSPDQGAMGLAFTGTATGDSIIVALEMPKASFRGQLINDSTILGSWYQGAATMPLALKKGSSYKVNRPQTPVPPFSYNSEDIEYDNADGSVHFGATFTYPRSGGPFATAILITGSGIQDRDETILGHKPFAVIADHLTKNGYAVLRIDDRGAGKTRGSLVKATSADFAKDVEAALAYLKTRKETDKSKTGLIGHSEGGLIAVMVAAANPEAIQFVITLAGPGEKGSKLMSDQNEAVWLKHGATVVAAAAYRDLFSHIASAVTPESDSASLYLKAWAYYGEWKKKQDPNTLLLLSLYDEQQSAQLLQRLVQAMTTEWMKYFLLSDPVPYIKQLRCKFLALNGSEDIQVVPRTNLPAMQAAIAESGIKVSEVKELKGLNHLFQHCTTCTPQEYGQLEESFAPEALDTMTNWLNTYIKK
ncbi:alpha/beta hydrolase family protein [Filimonas effusa]|uniref:Alpha/beta fold hydrolase n=1 Tax=Filimonas effusa TaxID=2508721 RepID=A0A4Q1D021_9BACT|nr:alpha/beta fold hydrolase [Filimonas effusa]RXK80926.1 alpha/beta fold hydrolase [Filimonas effusa]